MIRYPDPILRVLPLRRLMDRMLEDMAQGQQYEQSGGGQRESDAQAIPVNIFQTAEQLVLVAPMPGAHPNDIEINITQDTVYLRSQLRGPHQEDKDYLLREWTYGNYERTVRLPVGVDAEKANASFDNGLLVLNIPKRDVTRAHRVSLQTDASRPSELTNRGVQEARSGHETLRSDEDGSAADGPSADGSAPKKRSNKSAAQASAAGNGSEGAGS